MKTIEAICLTLAALVTAFLLIALFILMTGNSIGEVFYIKEDFWPLNTTLYVKNFFENDPLYISYLLRRIDFHTHSGKSGVPGVNRNDLHEIAVPPSSTVQRYPDRPAPMKSMT